MTVAAKVNSFPAPTRHQLVAEGSYMVATNPTVDTGLTWVAAQTAFSDTTPNFYIVNNEPAGGKSLYLDILKLMSTAVGTAAVSWRWAVKVDPVARSLTTDNTLAITPVNPNSEASNPISVTVKAQNSATASVISASSASAKLLGQGVLGGVNIVGHQYILSFGDSSIGLGGGITDAAGAPASSGDIAPAVVIAPQHNATIYIWGPSSSAALAPTFSLGMYAR